MGGMNLRYIVSTYENITMYTLYGWGKESLMVLKVFTPLLLSSVPSPLLATLISERDT
jgi:hypothetical protein